jgi:hypothetical protein
LREGLGAGYGNTREVVSGFKNLAALKANLDTQKSSYGFSYPSPNPSLRGRGIVKVIPT